MKFFKKIPAVPAVSKKIFEFPFEYFSKVKSIRECASLLERYGLCNSRDLSVGGIDILEVHCRELRAKGFVLESNLLGRAICRSIKDGSLAVIGTRVFSKYDSDFQRNMSAADECRDKGDFTNAEYCYWKALQLFPCHSTALVQYGHALKEQGKYLDSTVIYLDAYYFGAASDDLVEHLLYSAGKTKFGAEVKNKIKSKEVSLCSRSVRDVFFLLTGRMPSMDELLEVICAHSNYSSVVEGLIFSNDFKAANKSLLTLVKEKGLEA